MELNKAPAIILIIIISAILLGIGVTIIGGIETASKTSTGTSNETLTLASQAGTTASDDVVTVTFFGNGTTNSSQSGVTIGQDVNFTSAGAITTISNFSDGDYQIDYTFLQDSQGTAHIGTAITGIGVFPAWIAIIVLVASAAIIIGMVIKSFRAR